MGALRGYLWSAELALGHGPNAGLRCPVLVPTRPVLVPVYKRNRLMEHLRRLLAEPLMAVGLNDTDSGNAAVVPVSVGCETGTRSFLWSCEYIGSFFPLFCMDFFFWSFLFCHFLVNP